VSAVREVSRLHLIRVGLTSSPGVAVDPGGGNHHHQMAKRKSSITHRTQVTVTAFERGWQTIISWLARGDVVDGWKKWLNHFEEMGLGGVVNTSPSLGQETKFTGGNSSCRGLKHFRHFIVLSSINTLRMFIDWGR
jgi:hypothetical protein